MDLIDKLLRQIIEIEGTLRVIKSGTRPEALKLLDDISTDFIANIKQLTQDGKSDDDNPIDSSSVEINSVTETIDDEISDTVAALPNQNDETDSNVSLVDSIDEVDINDVDDTTDVDVDIDDDDESVDDVGMDTRVEEESDTDEIIEEHETELAHPDDIAQEDENTADIVEETELHDETTLYVEEQQPPLYVSEDATVESLSTVDTSRLVEIINSEQEEINMQLKLNESSTDDASPEDKLAIDKSDVLTTEDYSPYQPEETTPDAPESEAQTDDDELESENVVSIHSEQYIPTLVIKESDAPDPAIVAKNHSELSKLFTINDRFGYIRTIFEDQPNRFDNSINRIAQMNSLADAFEYLLNDLDLDPDDENVNSFIQVVSSYFNSK